jgi:AAA+ ATPase superfamily predicted ATPase
MIQGERRMGKTSLLYEVVRKLPNYRMLYVDLLEIKTADDLCKRIVRSLISMERQAGFFEKILKSLAQLRPVLSVDPVTGQPSVSFGTGVRLEPSSLDGIFDLIHDSRKRARLVVVFDEFQDVLNLPDTKETLAVLRSKIQFHTSIPYFFAGSVRNRMHEIFDGPESALFKSAIEVTVGSLDKEAFTAFLLDKFATGKRGINSGMIDRIIALAENVPGDVQELCGAIWETTSYRQAVNETCLGSALELIYARESKGYETALVQLTGCQLKCLTGIARLGGKSPLSSAFLKEAGLNGAASAKKALDRLIKLKLIYRHEGEYKFVNPFFKAWLIWKDF